MSSKARLTGFGPVAEPTATILILGSMPGARSLVAGEYYAHPQNSFWRILAKLIGLDPTAPYDRRLQSLTAAGIALWDVVHSCERAGSLDSAIAPGSIRINNFSAFFRKHPRIRRIGFNGATAQQLFQNGVAPSVLLLDHQRLRLPSTSPAFTIPFEQKLSAWRTLLDDPVVDPGTPTGA